jgi:competence ComEA-like helix-hairpin-helix protein
MILLSRYSKSDYLTFVILVCAIVSGCTRTYVQRYSPSVDIAVSDKAVNINTADVEELKTVPYIGDVFATRIIEFRTQNGKFRRREHLMLVPGISEKRFRQIRHLIRTE